MLSYYVLSNHRLGILAPNSGLTEKASLRRYILVSMFVKMDIKNGATAVGFTQHLCDSICSIDYIYVMDIFKHILKSIIIKPAFETCVELNTQVLFAA